MASKGFTIKRATSVEDLELYSRILVPAYGAPLEWVEPFVKTYTRLVDVDYYRHYIGYFEGKPVATSSVLMADGVAGLYNVATMPDARGKGVGGFMSSAPLVYARDFGYRVAILQSSDLGYPVYLRLGFQDRGNLVSYSPT